MLANVAAKTEIKDIVWYVRHDTPSFDNISLVNEHVLSKINTEFSYVSRTISAKPVDKHNRWSMVIGSLSGTEIPIYVIVGFQKQVTEGRNQKQNNAIFDTPDIIDASCKIGTARYPNNPYQIDFTINKYNEAYDEIR